MVIATVTAFLGKDIFGLTTSEGEMAVGICCKPPGEESEN